MELKAQQLKFLAQWLKEYELGQALKSGDDASESMAMEGELLSHSAEPYDVAIESGQIRLLSRSMTMKACRPFYVAVLAQYEEDGVWQIAPFSAYSVPAMPGELLLRSEGALALRTLCVWNSMAMAEHLLARSWVVDELVQAERTDSEWMLRHAWQRQNIAESLMYRLGAPILKDDDPRDAYRREEKILMAGVCRDTTDAPESTAAQIYDISPDAREPLRMVSEERTLYGPKKKHEKGGRDGEE